MFNAKGTNLRETKLPSRSQLETGKHSELCLSSTSARVECEEDVAGEREAHKSSAGCGTDQALSCWAVTWEKWEPDGWCRRTKGELCVGSSPRMEMGGINTKQTRLGTERPSLDVYYMSRPFCISYVSKFGRPKKKKAKAQSHFAACLWSHSCLTYQRIKPPP